jgi:hypothetical protein
MLLGKRDEASVRIYARRKKRSGWVAVAEGVLILEARTTFTAFFPGGNCTREGKGTEGSLELDWIGFGVSSYDSTSARASEEKSVLKCVRSI